MTLPTPSADTRIEFRFREQPAPYALYELVRLLDQEVPALLFWATRLTVDDDALREALRAERLYGGKGSGTVKGGIEDLLSGDRFRLGVQRMQLQSPLVLEIALGTSLGTGALALAVQRVARAVDVVDAVLTRMVARRELRNRYAMRSAVVAHLRDELSESLQDGPEVRALHDVLGEAAGALLQLEQVDSKPGSDE